MRNKRKASAGVYIVCILLGVLSILPFWIMIVNATRSTVQIQSHAISLIPSTHILENFKVLTGKTWNHPVVRDGRLYVRNSAEMACFELPGATASAG